MVSREMSHLTSSLQPYFYMNCLPLTAPPSTTQVNLNCYEIHPYTRFFVPYAVALDRVALVRSSSLQLAGGEEE